MPLGRNRFLKHAIIVLVITLVEVCRLFRDSSSVKYFQVERPASVALPDSNVTTNATTREDQPMGETPMKNLTTTVVIPFLKNKTMDTVKNDSVDDEIARILSNLVAVQTRYYLYTDKPIRQANEIRTFQKGAGKPLMKKRFSMYAKPEIDVFDALERHSLRTMDPDEAHIFIVPIPVSVIFTKSKCRQIFAKAFHALFNTTTFRDGHRHLIVSLNLMAFDAGHSRTLQKDSQLPNYYHRLENVTIATNNDKYVIPQLLQRRDVQNHDYRVPFSKRKAVTRYGFSLGLMVAADFPYIPASYEKFNNSSLFVFYRTRPEGSAFNSTIYRHAPLQERVVQSLANSSIGHDLPAEEWRRDFTSSKFCLVIRGDTPDSHALLRAVKVGCIPVVVSDYYPQYAPSLKSTLDMKHYCVFISEKSFLEDPLQELLALNEIPQQVIRNKLKYMSLVQRVMFPELPESLFVPALMKETLVAQSSKWHDP